MTKNEFKRGDNMTPKFTAPCFIRKNTPELRKKLEELGYRTLFSARYCYGNGICARNGLVSAYKMPSLDKDTIDCGTNEQLFLALAALREDSHKYQWHICTQEHITSQMKEYHVGDWNMCVHALLSTNSCWRKASPKELIEHFKNK